jgi:hypothetical protein
MHARTPRGTALAINAHALTLFAHVDCKFLLFSRDIPGLRGQESSTVMLDGQTVVLGKTATALYRVSYAQVLHIVALAKKGVPVRIHGIVFKSEDQQKQDERNSHKRKKGPRSATRKLQEVRDELEEANNDLDLAPLVASRSAAEALRNVIQNLLPTKDPEELLEVRVFSRGWFS